MKQETSPALNKIRNFKIEILSNLYYSIPNEEKEIFHVLFDVSDGNIEDIDDMVFEAAITMCETAISKKNQEVRELKKEINNLGFLENEYLSTCTAEGGEGTLWVFNHGSYSKIRHHLSEFIDNDRSFSKIEDWMIDTFYDYQFPVIPNIISITSATKEEYIGTFLLDYAPEEIGQECIKINFKY